MTVRSLRTDFVIGAGTPYLVTGAGGAVSGSADGTLRRLDEPLERGDSYRVRAYVPDPSAREMRAAPAAYDLDLLQYTRVALPLGGRDRAPPRPRRAAARRPPRASTVPLRRAAASAERRRRRAALADSPYAGTYRLARRLTAGRAHRLRRRQGASRTTSQSGFTYSERPPDAGRTRWRRSCSRTRSATASSSPARWR